MSAAPDSPPARLGRYEILSSSPLAGSARLFPARDPFLEREVLAKLLHRPSESPEREIRFRQEIRLSAAFSHPGLPKTLDAGEDGPWLYFVFERLAGRTLREEMGARERLALARALRVLIGVLAPLEILHGARIVHRDVKPENVFLATDPRDPSGRPVLVDLGIAKDRSDRGKTITKEGAGALGSEYYVAPEVVRHPERARFAADVYSAGVLLHEMLTGTLPIGENRPRLDEAAREAPDWLESLYVRMTAHDEHDRFQTAGEVLDALSIEFSPDEWLGLTTPPSLSPHPPPSSITAGGRSAPGPRRVWTTVRGLFDRRLSATKP